MLAKSNERIEKLMPDVKFRTEDLAEKQLDLFKSTLDQPTEQTDRIFRTLSDVSFTHNPAEEFARNKETYSTKGNPKARDSISKFLSRSPGCRNRKPSGRMS